MKKIFLLGFVAVLLGPVSAHAQATYSTVTLGAGGAMSFSVNGISIEVAGGGAQVATTTVSTESFELAIAPPTLILLKAPNLNQITVALASGATDYTLDSVCNGGLSQIEISSGTATSTFTITPDSALCTTGGGGGSGGVTPAPSGGGGGGGGGGAVVAIPATTPAPIPTPTGGTIAALQAQLNALLAQIAALMGGSTASSTFTRNLETGSTGADVKSLQVYLNSHGFQVASSGAGSPGNETTTFGGLTRVALAKLQAAVGISPTAGYFGPKTRAYVAAHP